MSRPRVYLDDAGSAPVLPEVREPRRSLPDGNPSSPHTEGRVARAALDRARDMAASALGQARTEITVVSSVKVAVNLVLIDSAGLLSTRARILTLADGTRGV